jgi:PAS domain S-box-containing protein
MSKEKPRQTFSRAALNRDPEHKKHPLAIASEENFEAYITYSPVSVIVVDSAGKFVYLNDAACKLVRYSTEELSGMNFPQLLFKEDVSFGITLFSDLLKTGRVFTEITVKTKDGQSVDVIVNAIKLPDGNMLAFCENVTKLKKTERELQESEERFRVIFEGATDGILVADAKSQRFVLANPQMCHMVGYPLEDLLKLSVPDIFPQVIVASLDSEFEKMAKGEKVTAQDIPLLRADKTIVDCEISSGLLEIWKQQCIVGFFRDVTERKKAEKQLQESYSALEKQLNEINQLQKELEKANNLLAQSNVDLENYTYVVSHDLKAPLRAIRSFSTFILEDYTEKLDDTGKDYFQRIIDASVRMDALIENLLLLSRVGRKFMEVETVDLNQLLEEITSELEPTLNKNNGTIVLGNLPKVAIPRTWMKQLFMNLIDNGLKFNKSKTPTVEVSCEEKDTELLFKVSDNGIGVEEKYFDRLFNLFERLHTQEEYPGTGAGLAICKKIVQQFGGKIWIESQVGKGSTFFFTLLKNRTAPLETTEYVTEQ